MARNGLGRVKNGDFDRPDLFMRVGRRKFSQMGGQTGNFSRKTGNLHENRRGNGPSSCFPVCFLFSCLAGDFGGSGDLKTARNGEFRAWKAENHLSRSHGGRIGIRAGTLRLGGLVRADRGPEIRDFLTQRHEDSKDMDLGPWPGTLCRCALV